MESSVESHAATKANPLPRAFGGVREAARRLYTTADPAIALLLAALLAATAFVGNGGLQLGRSTLVEVGVIAVGALAVAAALVLIGFEARLHGGLALAAVVGLAGLTALSIGWSLYPADSWVETNRTLAYVAAFAAGIAAVRIARVRWPAVLAGVLIALASVSLWGLATKVAPAWLAPDETFGRLRAPYGYWNAVGITAAMGIPLSLWLGTREGDRRVDALAWPLLGAFIVSMLLSFSRGSLVAAVVGIAVWLAIVPLRLRTLALLVPAVVAAGAVTAWAFATSALTDDRVALADRKHAGVHLGVILVAMIALLYAAGLLIQRRAASRPLSEPTRRRIGTAALAALAVAPVIALGALALSDRGIGGTISDRWHDLTKSSAVTPQNSPERLTETASVRSIYWRRAIDVWEKHKLDGAGAGSFAEAQLRFRDQPARGKHAHGYVLQTLADLGLIGLAVSVLALVAWALSVATTLDLRRGRLRAARDWPPERLALAALAGVVIVYGVHSALDWTWFVPAVTVTALFCAGWVAGRGPLMATTDERGPALLAALSPSLPHGPRLYRRVGIAAVVLVVAAVSAVAVTQPWRAQRKGNDALALVSSGQFAQARSDAERAHDLNPLSPEPYFDLAAVQDASSDRTGALRSLEHAVQVEPASAEAWTRLGTYLVQELNRPDEAIPILRGALFLDPLADSARAAFLLALRTQQARAQAAALSRRPAHRARKKPPAKHR
jgi:tetratricopeptide (TPR) repeat protein